MNIEGLMSFASIKNSGVHEAFKNEFAILSEFQRSIKDEVELRWNQGRLQMLFDILDTIENAKSEVEKIEANAMRAENNENAF